MQIHDNAYVACGFGQLLHLTIACDKIDFCISHTKRKGKIKIQKKNQIIKSK